MIKHFSSPDMLYVMATLLLAFLVAYYGTPLMRKLALRCGCLDIPDGKRKLHIAPIPYFGGLAIFAGFSASFLLFSYLLTGALPNELLVIFIGGLAICTVGLLDDMYGMRPLVKLTCQLLISMFTAHFGFTIEYITVFGRGIRFGGFAELVTVVWLVAIINAVNLIDGLDGLAGGVSALESFALLITAILMGNSVCAVASAALCGATLGFLPFNFGKATIFMGDAGSMFIGYIMACISVSGLFKAQALFSIIVPAMIFALPVMDAVSAFCRRVLRGQSPFAPDRKHLHHVLIEHGFTPVQSVLALMGAVAFFCIASVLYVKFPLVSLVIFVLNLGYVAILKYDKHLLARIKKRKEKRPVIKKPNETV